MFTGIVTALSIFISIGITKNVITDSSGKTSHAVKGILKDAIIWPKDLYNKYKDKI